MLSLAWLQTVLKIVTASLSTPQPRAPRGPSEVWSETRRGLLGFYAAHWIVLLFARMIPFVPITNPMIEAAIAPPMAPRVTVAC